MEEEKIEKKEEKTTEKKAKRKIWKSRKPKKVTKGRIIIGSIFMMIFYTTAFCIAFYEMETKLIRNSVNDDIRAYYAVRANNIIDETFEKYEYSSDNQFLRIVERMNGGKLTPEQKETQLRNRMLYLTGRINSIKIHDIDGIPQTQTVYSLYDEDFNPIGSSTEVLMLTRVDRGVNDWDRGSLYYTFYNDDVMKEIKRLDYEYYNKDETAVFHIDGAYLKDFDFVPEKLVCYIVGEGGKRIDEIPIYETELSQEEMEADGYTFFEVNDSFQTSNSFDNETHVAYLELKASGSGKYLKKGLDTLKNNPSTAFVDWDASDHDQITVKHYYIKQHKIVGTEKTYGYAIYAQENILYRKVFLGYGDGITLNWFSIMLIQFIIILAIAIVITVVHIRRRLRSFQSGE